ncbi:MAG: porin family protein [Gammaproteobacteria bacterium]|nr:porin family protein [Gammaproteobacteria bacterium]
MKKVLGALILGLGIFAGQAQADLAKLYYGLGVGDGSVDVTGGGDRSFGSFSATVGLQLLDFVGVELQAGAASDDIGSIFSESMVSYQAAMVRLGFRWDRVGLYALGGHALMDVDTSLNFSDSGTAIGGGINLFGNQTTSLNFHFIRLDEGAYQNASIGIQYYFGGFR